MRVVFKHTLSGDKKTLKAHLFRNDGWLELRPPDAGKFIKRYTPKQLQSFDKGEELPWGDAFTVRRA